MKLYTSYFCLLLSLFKICCQNFVEEKRLEMAIALIRVVVQLYENGENLADIAQGVNKSLPSIYLVIKKIQTQEVWKMSVDQADLDWSKSVIIVNVDRCAPLSEITTKFNENRNVAVSEKILKRRLKEYEFSL